MLGRAFEERQALARPRVSRAVALLAWGMTACRTEHEQDSDMGVDAVDAAPMDAAADVGLDGGLDADVPADASAVREAEAEAGQETVCEAGSSLHAGACEADDCSRTGCSGRGLCMGKACRCAAAYTGPACASCAPGYVLSAGDCVSDPRCPSSTCSAGAVECVNGSRRSCRTGNDGCPMWEAYAPCTGRECTCPAPSDAHVALTQWGMGTGRSSLRALAIDGKGALWAAGSVGQANAQTAAFAGVWSDASGAFWQQWGSESSLAQGLSLASDGSIFVAAQQGGALPSGNLANLGAATLTKFKADGSRTWTAVWDVTLSDSAYGVAQHPSGDLFVVGDTQGDLAMPQAGMYDAFVSRVSSAGAVLWTQQWGFAGIDGAYGVAVDSAGDVYVVGTLNGDAFCRKLDATGRELWTVRWSSPEYDVAKALTLVEGGVVVVGQGQGDLGVGSSAGSFVSRVSSAGAVQWTQQFAAPGTNIGIATAVALGPQGVLYIAGQTPGELVSGSAGGGLDVYLQARRLDGSVLFTKQVGGVFNEQVYAVSARADGAVFVGARTEGGFPQFAGYGGTRGDALLLRFDP